MFSCIQGKYRTLKYISLRSKGITFKYLIIFSFLFITYDGRSNVVDSLLMDSLLQVKDQLQVPSPSIQQKIDLIKLNTVIVDEYHDKHNFSKSLEVSLENKELLKGLEVNDTIPALIFFHIGYAYEWLNEYDNALEHFELSLKYSTDKTVSNIIQLRGKTFGRFARIYQNMGKYEKAFEYQLEALHMAETLKDSVNISTAQYQLGSLFFYQKQYDKALEYYKKAQKFAVGPKSDRMGYACLAAIGTTYESLDSLGKSLEYNKLSFAKAEEIDYQTGIAYSLSNIGSTYLSLNQYEKAHDYLTRSLTLKKELKDKWGQIGTLRSLGEMFITMNRAEEAVPYLEEAFSIASEIKSKTRQLELLNLFSKAYKELGQYEEALDYKEQFTALQDSVLNEKTLEQMGDFKRSYELEKKENEILLLKKDNELLEIAQEKDKLYNYLWTVVALSFGILMLLFISRYRVQKKSSELLKGKNEEINRQNGELQKVNDLLSDTNNLLEQNKQKIEEQNKALESSNEDLRNFASVASHDLKEPLRMIGSYTNILKRKYEGLFDERAHEFMGYVTDGVSRMEQLINSLLDYSRVSIDGNNQNYKLINLRDVVEVVKGNLRYPIVKSSATVIIENADDFPVIRANHIQMMQLIQNLISNALKFRGERLPVVTVGCSTKGDMHTFYIKDNGIGISKENQEKIFDMLTRLHTKQEYEGTGIGLATVRKIVERHNGKIWVESTEGEGSTFFFTTPVVKVPHSEIVAN